MKLTKLFVGMINLAVYVPRYKFIKADKKVKIVAVCQVLIASGV